MKPRSTTSRTAFTIVELGVAILVVAALIGLLLVGVAQISRTAQAGAERQNVVALRIAVDQFKADFGFLPPLMEDGILYSRSNPPDPTGTPPLMGAQLSVYDPGVPEDVEFLRRDTGTMGPDLRFSVYSLPTYLIGVQDFPVDGSSGPPVDGKAGPGFRTPTRSGTFRTLGGTLTDPLFDVRGDSERLVIVNPEEGRAELRDRSGVPYRFYRWLPDEQIGGPDPSKSVGDLLNVPAMVGDPAENVELRDAGYAIVAAGPNRVFGEMDTETVDRVIREVGRVGDGSDEASEAAGRADNIIEVGK
ncbi:MAG: type II secretion system protein [Planctomycetota bacterium]